MTIELDRLPHVLAGPIVRRVAPGYASVWLACKQETSVVLTVKESADPYPQVASGEATTVAVGEHVHVVCVTARVDAGAKLNWGTEYLYTLRLTPNGQSEVTWADAIGADANGVVRKLGWRRDRGDLTFLLPPNRPTNLRLAHGSCRKLHGAQPDALTLLLDRRRPHLLMLTGDQIYADDVDAYLYRVVNSIADALMGSTQNDGLKTDEIAAADDGVRDTKLREAGFSGNRERHLVTFRQFVAMYLLAWSDVFWSEVGAEVATRIAITRAHQLKVRRIFANTPTYMIFDDHDVTDDWNFRKDWIKGVVGRELDASLRPPLPHRIGSSVIRHALAAFVAFQAWGNEGMEYADQFATHGPGAKILELIGRGIYSPGARDELDVLLGVCRTKSERSAGEDPNFGYEFRVETPPGYKLAVLDTRTWRDVFHDRGTADPVGLITLGRIAKMIDKLQLAHSERQQLLILVSPVPVVGLRYLEAGQHLLGRSSTAAARTLDVESWNNAEYRKGYNDLVFTMGNNSVPRNPVRAPVPHYGEVAIPIVFLSGDVHFSCGSRQVVKLREVENAEPVRSFLLTQLTSSALKNYGTFPRSDRFHGGLLLALRLSSTPPSARASVSRYTSGGRYVSVTEGYAAPVPYEVWEDWTMESKAQFCALTKRRPSTQEIGPSCFYPYEEPGAPPGPTLLPDWSALRREQLEPATTDRRWDLPQQAAVLDNNVAIVQFWDIPGHGLAVSQAIWGPSGDESFPGRRDLRRGVAYVVPLWVPGQPYSAGGG